MTKAVDITADRIAAYIAQRQHDGAANASNAELRTRGAQADVYAGGQSAETESRALCRDAGGEQRSAAGIALSITQASSLSGTRCPCTLRTGSRFCTSLVERTAR